MVVLGQVAEDGLRALGEHVEKFVGLQALQFEESKCKRWTKESMNLFVEGFKKSEVLLDVKLSLLDETNKKFACEIQFYAEANRKKAELKRHLGENEDEKVLDKFFTSLM